MLYWEEEGGQGASSPQHACSDGRQERWWGLWGGPTRCSVAGP